MDGLARSFLLTEICEGVFTDPEIHVFHAAGDNQLPT